MDTKQFGNQVKMGRKALGLSRSKFADNLAVSFATVLRIEKGQASHNLMCSAQERLQALGIEFMEDGNIATHSPMTYEVPLKILACDYLPCGWKTNFVPMTAPI